MDNSKITIEERIDVKTAVEVLNKTSEIATALFIRHKGGESPGLCWDNAARMVETLYSKKLELLKKINEQDQRENEKANGPRN